MRAVNLNIWSAALAMATALTGCARTETSWTPETVAPPPLAEAAIEAPASLESRTESLTLPAEISSPVALTRDGAILTTLLNNRRIEVARRGREQAIVKSGVAPGDRIATRRPATEMIRRTQ